MSADRDATDDFSLQAEELRRSPNPRARRFARLIDAGLLTRLQDFIDRETEAGGTFLQMTDFAVDLAGILGGSALAAGAGMLAGTIAEAEEEFAEAVLRRLRAYRQAEGPRPGGRRLDA